MASNEMTIATITASLGQLYRYGIVGLCSNVALYAAYLAITYAGLGHKLAMSSAFGAGILISFRLNRDWSFKSSLRHRVVFFKYSALYIFVYFFCLLAMWALVDGLGLMHQVVQLFLMVFSAGLIFILLKVWVFDDRARS